MAFMLSAQPVPDHDRGMTFLSFAVTARPIGAHDKNVTDHAPQVG